MSSPAFAELEHPPSQAVADLFAALAAFTEDQRLYAIDIEGAAHLVVESFHAHEACSELFVRDIVVLSTDAGLDIASLAGRRAKLAITLPDGALATRSGIVQGVARMGADGGFARFRLTVVPWLYAATQQRNSRVWQDKSALAIVEEVFTRYAALASWRLADEVAEFMADSPIRDFCAQYRETDYAFIARLLAEEGLGFFFEELDDAPDGHRMVLFSDSTRFACDPSAANAPLRFHRADSQEEADTIRTLSATRRLQAAATTLLSYDYVTKKSIAAQVPTGAAYAGKSAPALESYDAPGAQAFATSGHADRAARLLREAAEARNKTWQGSGTVRTLRPGAAFALSGTPLNNGIGTNPLRLATLSIESAGKNNLPAEAHRAIDVLFSRSARTISGGQPPDHAPLPSLRGEKPAPDSIRGQDGGERPFQADDTKWMQTLSTTGYVMRFTAVRADIPWRPALGDSTGTTLNPRPTAPGAQTAIVVGANGHASPDGADELYCDRLGRIRVRFHWQEGTADDDRSTCWLRVAQRHAGAGMGAQFLPRIGQEVLVAFLEGDIDRPIVVGSLYNGQGEGGLRPTPGGTPGTSPPPPPQGEGGDGGGIVAKRNTTNTLFAAATNFAAAAQGNLASGNAPAWHGASPDAAGQRNAAALSGFKSKEFGGSGHNQLVFDDSDGQLRTSLATTAHATQLNLGHLIHQADNHRGGYRGQGFELRSDAYAALVAERGLLLTTYGSGGADAGALPDPVGDFTAGQALVKQALTLGKNFNTLAATHKTVRLAAATGAGKADTSMADPKAAPLAAFDTIARGMVESSALDRAWADACKKNTTPGTNQVPHFTDPVVAFSAKAELALVAGQDVHFAAGETIMLAAGQDSSWAAGGRMRWHSGQGIGVLAGVVEGGAGASASGSNQESAISNTKGLSLIAAKGAVDIQAQSETLTLAAQKALKLVSVSASVDFTADKAITLKTAGGASLTIEGGNITFACPGTITVHAAKKSFSGPTQLSREMNAWPKVKFDDRFVLRGYSGGPPVPNQRVRIRRSDGALIDAVSDADGRLPIQQSDLLDLVQIEFLKG